MTLRRRAFLQRACWALAGLGLSDAWMAHLGARYQQALAQPGRRKLALLVGINEYPGQALQGCETDLDLQRELLVHRFGFQPSDILVLSNQQATREKIETAFIEHLGQARAEDVVLFHFSGCGCQVGTQGSPVAERAAGSGSLPGYRWQQALVPVDGGASEKQADNTTANVLLEDTLFLLLRSLPTDQVTTVLDTSYIYPGSPMLGGLRVRVQAPLKSAQPAVAELDFQERLLRQTELSREQVQVQRRSNQMPGLVLAAAGIAQLAMEAQWPGFEAGLFTYALTQHLWTATPATTIWSSCSQVATDLQQWAGQNQQPTLRGQKSHQNLLFPYDLEVENSADGVITAVDNGAERGQLWLAGLPAAVLSHFQTGGVFRVLSPGTAGQGSSPEAAPSAADEPPPASSSSAQVQVQSRSGLVAKGRWLQGRALQPGYLLQESIRVFPQGIGLAVALDSNLERIERVDATSAFSGVARVTTTTAGDPADYLFARAQQLSAVQVSQSEEAGGPWHVLVSNPSQLRHSYGLFFLGEEPLPNSIGEPGESVKAAVRRLTPKLHVLLASKLLNLTENAATSRLGVRATLEVVAPTPNCLIQQQTCRAPWPVPTEPELVVPQSEKEGSIATVPTGSRVQYRVHNYSDRPVYLTLLNIDSSASAFVYYAPAIRSDQPELKLLLKNQVIEPGGSLLVPHQSNAFEWVVRGPTGLTTTYLLLSRVPFNRTLASLEAAMRQSQSTDGPQIAPLPNALEVAQAVLQDLSQASTETAQGLGISGDLLALDVDRWATLRFTYRVI